MSDSSYLFGMGIEYNPPVSHPSEHNPSSFDLLGVETSLLVADESKMSQAKYRTELAYRIHDLLYWKWGANSRRSINNPLENYNAFYGILNGDADYTDANQYGESVKTTPLKDYSFFSTNIDIIKGLFINTPIDFDLQSISEEAYERKIEKVSKMATEDFFRSVSSGFQQESGLDLTEALTDPKQSVPDKKQLYEYLDEKEQVELLLHDLLTYTEQRYNTTEELVSCLQDKCIVETQAAEVVVHNNDVRLKRIHPKNISWLGAKNVTDADECDAISLVNYIPISTAVQKYGIYLDQTIKHEFELLPKKFRNGGLEFTHYPNFSMYSRGSVDGEGETMYNKSNEFGWFYTESQGTLLITEQKTYYKLIRHINCEVTIDGRPVTEDEWNAHKSGTFDRSHDVMYNKIEDGDEKGKFIKKLPFVELWESVRLGHKYVIYTRKYPYTYRPSNSKANISFPVILQSYETQSMITKGINIQQLYNSVMRLVRKLVNTAGISAIAYDESQLPDGMSLEDVIYEAKEAGLLTYNGRQINGSPTRESTRHLTRVETGMNDDVARLISLCAMLHETYDQICGITPSMKGILANRQGQKVTETAISQGNLVLANFFRQNDTFVGNCLRILANIGKQVWHKEKRKSFIKDGHVKILNLVKDIELEDVMIFIQNGFKSREKKERIIGYAEQAISSGQASLKDLVMMTLEDNPLKVKAMYEAGIETYEKLSAQSQEAQQSAEQVKLQLEQMKVEMPKIVAEINAKATIESAKIKAGSDLQKQDEMITFEEDMADIQTSKEMINQNENKQPAQ